MGACGSKGAGRVKGDAPADDRATKAAAERNTVLAGRSNELPRGLEATHKAIRLLGRGATADTWLFEDNRNGRQVAVKLFARPLPAATQADVVREVQVQSELAPGSVNLINVYELTLTEEYLAIVMECAHGGTFTARVAERLNAAEAGAVVVPEDELRFYFRQFIETIDYCHRNKTAHRDLKLDNFLLDERDPPFTKLCDFGFARHFGMGALARTRSHIGTPEYMSPELLHHAEDGADVDYDPQLVDVWAAGVLLSVALCGAFPFDHTRPHEGFVEDAELDLWLQEVTHEWSKSPFLTGNLHALSPEVRDLLGRIFTVDPARRISLAQIRQHPWYQKPVPPRFQRTLDELAAEQKLLDAHVARRRLDPAKLEERNRAIRDLVAQAVHPGGKKPEAPAPGASYDCTEGRTVTVDLTEEAVWVTGAEYMGRKSLEIPIVAERSGHDDRPARSSVNGGRQPEPTAAVAQASTAAA